ncbi:hypothetical protein ALP86_102363 [Pseudomonas amygdali pv. mori]|uniref:Uncharacterized protein n=8 Tax=Pseudomonas syringae group TaxID=136849 RepID=A0AAX1VXB3_PSEAJ|nr:Unknown protein sequence [Pseudomonas amygdali pv. sesami]KPB40373.1 Unknown protein sequence [Pseudomonas savastanoi pv. phaseolicola]KPB65851.1 Unknown protein sequence [Pseudomonas amygdali pv. mellea]KPX77808.1 hypothetical protein ALO35_102372 [Pseudomonas amygdali pv. lachrymans]KPY06007.1 hypothetical protein ALO63_102462 [Pseudomonas amygdali pv. mori]KPY76683.1 hypothetical protein ALO60_101859 [Pseudomonas amygdali pv. tabaci]RMM59651.1 hypothetical protein ALQ74_102583 [Pseudomo
MIFHLDNAAPGTMLFMASLKVPVQFRWTKVNMELWAT